MGLHVHSMVKCFRVFKLNFMKIVYNLLN